MMQSFPLPGIPQPLSVVCLGTALYGSAFPQEQSFALMDAYADAGGNFLDTAHVYADWLPGGTGASERTVGAWLRERGVRDQSVVATKGGHPRLETMHQARLHPEDIAQDIQESLERLGIDTIDLYWLHRDAPEIPVGEILGALNEHLTAGRIRAIGASNWRPTRLAQASEYAAAHGLIGFCASQIGWSLAEANPSDDPSDMLFMDTETLDYTQTSGLKIIPFSSQATGFFAKPYDPTGQNCPVYHNAENEIRWLRVQELAQQMGEPANSIALAYLLNHPAGGAAIVGCRTVAQVHESCAAARIVLGESELRYLEGKDDLGV